jgi:hypothetical protein
LIESSDWKGLFTINGQFPVGKQILLMNFNPSDDKLVLFGMQFTCQKSPIKNRIDGHFTLIIGMDMRHMMFLDVSEKHPNQDSIEH